MKRPRIAVTLTGTKSIKADEERQRYLDAVTVAGGEPIGIQVGMTIPEFDGLFLSGGKDVSPEHGGARDPNHVKATDPMRDALEKVLLTSAIDANRAVLAVCRGFQLLNVHLGGTLQAHVPGHEDDLGGVHEHVVIPLAGSHLADATACVSFTVNSRHTKRWRASPTRWW
jgi:putative glutamine amidotransferase